MRKVKAIIAATTLCLASAALCAVWGACSRTEETISREQAFAELDGFFVRATDTAEIGEEYSVTSVVAFGADGKEYEAKYTVSASGNAVETKNGKFIVLNEGDYTIAYTLEYRGYSFEISTVLTPTDTVAPSIALGKDYSKHKIGESIVLPSYEASDGNGSGVKEVRAVIITPDGEEMVAESDTYTPEEAGRYEFKITATDNFGNSETRSTCFFAGSGVKKEYAAFEDFNEGYDDSVFALQAELSFDVAFEGDNTYLSSKVVSLWPVLSMKGEMVAEYMKAGYDALNITMWGNNETPFVLFLRSEGVYHYYTIPAGSRGHVRISAENIAKILEYDTDLKFYFIVDPIQYFDLCIDDIRGEYNGAVMAVAGESRSAGALLPETFNDIAKNYELYDTNGEMLKSGGIEDIITFENKGAYTLKLNLGELGEIFVNCTVGAEIQITENDAWPNLKISADSFDGVFEDASVQLVKIGVKGDNRGWHNVYAVTDNRYVRMNPGEAAELWITRDQWKKLKTDKREFVIVIWNTEAGTNCEKVESFTAGVEYVTISDIPAAAYFTAEYDAWPNLVLNDVLKKLFADSTTESVVFKVAFTAQTWHNVNLMENANVRLEKGGEAEFTITRETYKKIAEKGTNVFVMIWNCEEGTHCEKVENFYAFAYDFIAVKYKDNFGEWIW